MLSVSEANNHVRIVELCILSLKLCMIYYKSILLESMVETGFLYKIYVIVLSLDIEVYLP